MRYPANLKSKIVNLKSKEAFIFDLDGVLVDTARFHYMAWKRLAETLGFDFSMQQNEKLKGVSRMQSLEYLLEWSGIQKTVAEKQRLATLKNDWYLELVDEMTPSDVLPGALDLLEYAKANHVKTAVGSASKNARRILERLSMLNYFDAIIDGNSVVHTKPNPEVFIKAAQFLEVTPETCLVFEDAQAGIEAAKAAGMQVVGIGKATDLQGADLVISGLADLKMEYP